MHSQIGLFCLQVGGHAAVKDLASLVCAEILQYASAENELSREVSNSVIPHLLPALLVTKPQVLHDPCFCRDSD